MYHENVITTQAVFKNACLSSMDAKLMAFC